VSRILLATFGSLGDLHPYIAVGRALRARGQQVVVATSSDYRAAVEEAGLEFAPVRPSIESLGDKETVARVLFDPLRGAEHLVREFLMVHLRDTYEDMTRAAVGADLLVSHPITFTVQLVAERMQRPWVSTVLAPLSMMSVDDPPVLSGAEWIHSLRRFGRWPYVAMVSVVRSVTRRWEAPLREFRRELGFPASSKLYLFEGQFSPLANFALFDAPLAAPQADWPFNTQVCGTPLFDGAMAPPDLLADLEQFLAAGEPPLVFVLGSSAIWMAGDYWNHAIAATQLLNRRAILITGPNVPTGLPSGIRAYSYLPYSAVLPRAAAVLHHAGIGTLSQALRAGVPQIITPVAFDQPDNAARAARLGVARVLPFRRVMPQRLRDEIAALLGDPTYAGAARRIADDLRKTDGAAVAADRLIACLAQR